MTSERYVKTSILLAAITLAFLAIILIGQFQLYPQLRAIETRIESLETQQSPQTRPPQSPGANPRIEAGLSDGPIQRAQPCAGGDD
jgi:hypothetical protein